MKTKVIALALLICLPFLASSQNKVTPEDYQRAVSFMWKNINNKEVFNLYVQPHWFKDKSGLWFIEQSKNSKIYYKIEFKDIKKSELFDHEMLAQSLNNELSEDFEAYSLNLNQLKKKEKDLLSFKIKNDTYTWNSKLNQLNKLDKEEKKNELESVSPNKDWIAYSKDYNLHIKSAKTGEIKQLSFDGLKNYEYGTYWGWYDIIKGETDDRPEHFNVDWSEDGKWIYANLCDLRNAQKMYLLDWSQDSLYRPELLGYYRGSPGDTTMVYDLPVFFNIETGEEIHPPITKGTHINSASIQWSETSGLVYILEQKRGYQHIKLSSFNLNTKELHLIYEESSETNIDNFSYRLAEESGYIFFLSEKSGWKQLYTLELKSGTISQLAAGNYFVNDIDYIDEKSKRIYFRASGKEAGRNPYLHHLYSISFKGKGLKLLSPEDRHHQISFSKDGKYFVDNYSTANEATKTVLRNSKNAKIITELASADIKALKGWSPPELFSLIAKDEKTTIYGALWKPTNFDPKKKYPVIDHSYTGPHTQMYPKDFRRVLSLENQAIAELGFIVVMIDGLGSSGRSKEFHNYSYKNLGGGLVDHVRAIKYLGNKFEWMDTEKVGIFGHSAGGYDAAHALLAFPDFYKVGVSSSADHDHRMEKAWWPEMYMGWPVDSAYHTQSNITMAANLKGKLLITHGGIDDNVNPSATFKLADAFIKADKQFDMLILPSQRHGYRGDAWFYFTKSKWNYFVKHLLETDPIWDFKWE